MQAVQKDKKLENNLHWLLDLARTQGSGHLVKNLLAPLAFFILLRWAEKQEQEEEAVASFDERPFERLLPLNLYWSDLLDLDPLNFSSVFRHHLLPGLESLHGNQLAETLRMAAYTLDPKKTHEVLLYESMRFVADLPFDTPSDYRNIDQLIVGLISQLPNAKSGIGEYITSPQVADLMIAMADPQPGERIYDPCFGLGSLLRAAGRHLFDEGKGLLPSAWFEMQSNSLFGIERSSAAFLIGMTRIILSGINFPRLDLGNTLERDMNSTQGKFDLILADPPVGLGFQEGWHPEHYRVRARNTENLFLQHIMTSLRPGGRALVCLPEGLLFRGGPDQRVREWLSSGFSVDGVISLPRGVNLPYTGIKSNIIVFRNSAPGDSIWFQEVQVKRRTDSRIPPVIDTAIEARIFLERKESENAWKVSREDIALRNFDLSVKKALPDELGVFLAELKKSSPELTIVTFADIADFKPGISYTREVVSEEETAQGVPMLRVSEIARNGELKLPRLFLRADILKIKEDRRLQTGDLLVSVKGTIGKVGRVREAFEGAIPAHGLIRIRLKDRAVNPLYLMRLLQSAPYQQWMARGSHGTTIKNLSVGHLALLPIPVLPDRIQQAVASEINPNADAGEIIKAIIAGSDYDEVLSSIQSDRIITELLVNGDFSDMDDATKFSQLAGSLQRFRDIAARDERVSESAITKWLSKACSLVESIVEAFEFSKGADRFAMLEIARREVDALNALADDLIETIKTRLRAITAAIRQTLINACWNILKETSISAYIENAIVEAGIDTSLSIKLRNDGSLPLRRVNVHTTPETGSATLRFLGAGEEAVFSVNIPPREVGDYPVRVHWEALRLDNEPVADTISLSYSVRPAVLALVDREDDWGTNPYVAGNPLASTEELKMFYGREDIISRVRRSLRSDGPSTVILLEGNRRVGKTSILYKLGLTGVLPEWIPVYLSFQGAAGHKKVTGLETKEVFYMIARELVRAVHKAGYELEVAGMGIVPSSMPGLELMQQLRTQMRPQFSEESSYELLSWQVDAISKVLVDKRLVLMLDEFDKIQEGIDNGITSPQTPENLRALFHANANLSAILSGARIRQLRENYWSALYGIGVRITVDALDSDSAKKLITEPVEGRVVFSEDARDHALALCSCQAYLIQSLCHRIFEKCATRKQRNVTLQVVESAARELVEDYENFSTLFYQDVDHDRCRYIACLVLRLSETLSRVSFDLLKEKLEENGLAYSATDLEDDLKQLQKLNVIALYQTELGVSYRIKIPLFAKWMWVNVDEEIHRQQAVGA